MEKQEARLGLISFQHRLAKIPNLRQKLLHTALMVGVSGFVIFCRVHVVFPPNVKHSKQKHVSLQCIVSETKKNTKCKFCLQSLCVIG